MAKQNQADSAGARARLRAGLELVESGEFSDALEKLDQVLEEEPGNVAALLAALQASCGAADRRQLADGEEPLEENLYYRRLLPLADDALRSELQGYAKTVTERLQEAEAARAKEQAAQRQELEEKKADYLAGADQETRDRYAAEERRRKTEAERNEAIYQAAMALKNGRFSHQYQEAAARFRTIRDYRDAEEQAAVCEKLAARSAFRQRIIALGLLVLFAALVVAFCFGRGYH